MKCLYEMQAAFTVKRGCGSINFKKKNEGKPARA